MKNRLFTRLFGVKSKYKSNFNRDALPNLHSDELPVGYCMIAPSEENIHSHDPIVGGGS